VVGSGGREHSLAWRLARDPDAPEVLVAPGNAGMSREFECLDVTAGDADGLLSACRRRAVDLVVVGPEQPLAAGLVDTLSAGGVTVFGPVAEAARLESSKWFAKGVMEEAGIPTARADSFEDPARALAALSGFGPPWVIKADGLAAGKGVRVTRDRPEAEEFLRACLGGGRFGASGRRVVLEEFLDGEEVSIMAVCDGERFAFLPSARDFKRAHDGDLGPNTGGMGAFAPHPSVDAALEEEVGCRVVEPLLAAMRARGTPYRGTLYCGLMLGSTGPRVVEFNARFGDPETQAVMPLLDGSWSSLMAGAARGSLDPKAVSRRAGGVVSVALTDSNYPGEPGGSGMILGLEEMSREAIVFHAGTVPEGTGWRVAGGRACYVTVRGESVESARDAVYAAIGRLGGSGWRYRKDVAARIGATHGAGKGD
jgi:phosphoribosylamine--glycine ligase